MLLKDSSGYHPIALSEITSMDATVVAYGPSVKETSRTVDGDQARQLLKVVHLNAPKEPGSLLSLVTGTIVLHYGTKTRKLNILGGKILEDSEHFESLYETSRDLDET
ncbi:MAG: hypothetical protein ACXVBW_07780, partial [Bdellovibrionota bacterium]